MPFVQGKCENCGGVLAVDPSLNVANCPFCGTAYVVQDSINNYNTSIKVESMHANVVNVVDESSSEARLKAGAAYLKIGKFDFAEKEYQFVTKTAPQNYLGWLGLIESKSNNYSRRIKSASELRLLNEYALSASTLAPSGSNNSIIEKCISYLRNEEERNAVEKESIAKVLADCANQLKPLFDESKSLSEQIEQKEKRLSYLTSNNNLNTSNSVTKYGCFLGIGLLLTPIGLILLLLLERDSSMFLITGFMLVFGSASLLCSIAERIRLGGVRKEIKTIRADLEKSKPRLQEINNQKANVQSALASAQTQLNEYR